MHLRWPLFAVLACSHAAVALVAPEASAPVAGSVYLPLMLLQAVGIPVFAAAESGGWAVPSLLGWAAVLILWFAIWWAVASFLSRLFHRESGRA